jgi:uncharacterized membrane protein YedE/YeeE
LFAISLLKEKNVKLLMAAVSGMVFGIGLILSGMTDPGKVQAFLDLAGSWDPSLALVMGGALVVTSIGYLFVMKRSTSLLGEALRLPTTKQIDRRLVLGGLTFGVGWGLAGYCPGPALASLIIGGTKPLVFVTAMVAGMAIFELLERRNTVALAAHIVTDAAGPASGRRS